MAPQPSRRSGDRSDTGDDLEAVDVAAMRSKQKRRYRRKGQRLLVVVVVART